MPPVAVLLALKSSVKRSEQSSTSCLAVTPPGNNSRLSSWVVLIPATGTAG